MFWESCDVLKLGLWRRVGTGDSINILRDPWLPCRADPYVHPTHPALVNKYVLSSLKMGAREREMEVITYLFNDRDASLISSITISYNLQLRG